MLSDKIGLSELFLCKIAVVACGESIRAVVHLCIFPIVQGEEEELTDEEFEEVVDTSEMSEEDGEELVSEGDYGRQGVR